MDSILLPPPAPSSLYGVLPNETESFASGVFQVLKNAVYSVFPSISIAAGLCLSILAISMLLGIINGFDNPKMSNVVGTIAVTTLIISPFRDLIETGIESARGICEYDKLLLPVMAAGLASQGAISSATALYAVTAVINSVLSNILCKGLLPAIYAYIAFCIASSASDQEYLQKIADFIHWSLVWVLKIVLYVFTGFLSITGVVSGTVDASALKATKMAISGMMPVIGGILSDASEAVLVSLGTVKNAAGIYGLFVILGLGCEPILRISVQYLFIKFASAISEVFGKYSVSKLVQNLCDALGIVVSITGIVCILSLIGIVCFLKGVA